MQNIVIEEPYKFIPPMESRLWPPLIRLYLPRFLRKTYGIHTIETRHAERLKASIDAGRGVMLAPNHCRMSDPLMLSDLTGIVGCNIHAMASWHLFKQSRLNCFMLRRVGAFSLYREGVDRQAIDAAIDILVAGKRPLVLFAEGAISRHNDQLMPMMDGVSFIARTAAKRREKAEAKAGIVIHPVAIRYFYRGDLVKTVTPVLEEIEGHFSWFPQNDKPLIARLRQIAQALLSLKEIEYFGWARTGDFYERVDNLINDLLAKIEKDWKIRPTSEGVVSRVKTLRGAILPTLLNPATPADVKDSCRKQLAACYYVQQMSHYPRNYVRQSEKNIPEHILETVERFEEDFTDQVRIHGPLHAVVDVGEAIEVSSKRDRGGEGDPVMDAIHTRLSGMLTALSDESPRI